MQVKETEVQGSEGCKKWTAVQGREGGFVKGNEMQVKGTRVERRGVVKGTL